MFPLTARRGRGRGGPAGRLPPPPLVRRARQSSAGGQRRAGCGHRPATARPLPLRGGRHSAPAERYFPSNRRPGPAQPPPRPLPPSLRPPAPPRPPPPRRRSACARLRAPPPVPPPRLRTGLGRPGITVPRPARAPCTHPRPVCPRPGHCPTGGSPPPRGTRDLAAPSHPPRVCHCHSCPGTAFPFGATSRRHGCVWESPVMFNIIIIIAAVIFF